MATQTVGDFSINFDSNNTVPQTTLADKQRADDDFFKKVQVQQQVSNSSMMNAVLVFSAAFLFSLILRNK